MWAESVIRPAPVISLVELPALAVGIWLEPPEHSVLPTCSSFQGVSQALAEYALLGKKQKHTIPYLDDTAIAIASSWLYTDLTDCLTPPIK